jgi:hypothetical protein
MGRLPCMLYYFADLFMVGQNVITIHDQFVQRYSAKSEFALLNNTYVRSISRLWICLYYRDSRAKHSTVLCTTLFV